MADLRFGAANALSAKIKPKRNTCGLRMSEGSKMISGRTNLILTLSVSSCLKGNGYTFRNADGVKLTDPFHQEIAL